MAHYADLIDDGKPEEGRIARKADCLWEDHQAQWYACESRKFEILLSVRKGRGRARKAEEGAKQQHQEQAIETQQ
jgi:hypothetical protein